MAEIYQAFIPLFVAIDALGILPIFISLTNGMSVKEKRKLALQSVVTALIICLVVLFAGRLIFDLLSITVDDLRIGGGLILLVLAITDLLFSSPERKAPGTVGIVPIGSPLIAGPTTITAVLILNDTVGAFPTLLGLIINIAFVFVVFYFSEYVVKIMGNSGSIAFAKVMNLFLAAIAVHMITTGIIGIVSKV